MSSDKIEFDISSESEELTVAVGLYIQGRISLEEAADHANMTEWKFLLKGTQRPDNKWLKLLLDKEDSGFLERLNDEIDQADTEKVIKFVEEISDVEYDSKGTDIEKYALAIGASAYKWCDSFKDIVEDTYEEGIQRGTTRNIILGYIGVEILKR